MSIRRNIATRLFLCATTLVALVGCSSAPATAMDTRVVISGEDSDARSVSRDAEVFKRVMPMLQESLRRAGYEVIDEDMLALKVGFSFNSRRPKTELIETLMVANDTQDASVQSRIAVIFAIFPDIKKGSAFRKVEVRIRGDVYDLKNLTSLANFEYSSPKSYVIPKNPSLCDNFCVEEKIGENARDVARELGDVLAKKLDISIAKIEGGSGNSGATASGGLTTTYNLTMVRFSTKEMLKFKKALVLNPAISELDTIASQSTQRVFSLKSSADLSDVEEAIFETLLDLDVDIDLVRSEMSNTDIYMENLN